MLDEMVSKWKYYAAGEGLAKTASNVVKKVIGLSGGTFGTGILATLVIGVIQTGGGLIGALIQRKPLFYDWKLLIGPFFFGISATIATVSSFAVFTYEEADLGVFVFITLLSIFPGVFIDWIFFKTPLTVPQWFGVFTFLFGGYAILDFPVLNELLNPPPWVLISFVAPLTLAFNEGVTRGISMREVSDPFVNNFWIGLTTIIVTTLSLVAIGMRDVLAGISVQFWVLSSLIGLIVLTMISFKLLSYKSGGTIAFKKVIVQGVYLISSILLGAAFFAQPITSGKIIGVVAFFIAVVLMEKKLRYSTAKFLKAR